MKFALLFSQRKQEQKQQLQQLQTSLNQQLAKILIDRSGQK